MLKKAISGDILIKPNKDTAVTVNLSEILSIMDMIGTVRVAVDLINKVITEKDDINKHMEDLNKIIKKYQSHNAKIEDCFKLDYIVYDDIDNVDKFKFAWDVTGKNDSRFLLKWKFDNTNNGDIYSAIFEYIENNIEYVNKNESYKTDKTFKFLISLLQEKASLFISYNFDGYIEVSTNINYVPLTNWMEYSFWRYVNTLSK